MTSEPVRLGVVGLGRAFVLMLPAFRSDPRIRMVAAAAPRADSRAAFEAEFGGNTYDSIEALCADPDVEAIYIATPHELHAEHVVAAARAGKHILVDKPLAIDLEDGARMVAAARSAGVHLIVGPSHSFDGPVELARRIIESGEFGQLRMIQALNYTDFLYRPRRPEELRTETGGGIIFSQAVHQIDVTRLLAGGQATRVMAMTGNWDPKRPTEGSFSAMMAFANGVFATMTYSGYAHFDSDIWMDDVGELGIDKLEDSYGAARRALSRISSDKEADLKSTRTYGRGAEPPPAKHHEHFGPVIAVCEHGDLQLTPNGVKIFGDTECQLRTAPHVERPRSGVLDALVAAIRQNIEPAQTGEWGLASLEVCHAILESARSGQAFYLKQQIAANKLKGPA